MTVCENNESLISVRTRIDLSCRITHNYRPRFGLRSACVRALSTSMFLEWSHNANYLGSSCVNLVRTVVYIIIGDINIIRLSTNSYVLKHIYNYRFWFSSEFYSSTSELCLDHVLTKATKHLAYLTFIFNSLCNKLRIIILFL